MYLDDRDFMTKMIIIISIMVLLIFLSFVGCKSFKAVQLPDQTPECNDFYTVLQYYSVQGKDSAFVGTVYNECKNSRDDKKQKKIEKLCNDLYSDKVEFAKCIK